MNRVKPYLANIHL